jgi:metal transporter CNNM
MTARVMTLLVPVLHVLGKPILERTMQDEEAEPVGSSSFWWKIGVSIGLVLLGGLFAGLTLGLMGLDELHLRVLATSSSSPKEKKNAQKVLRLLNRGKHWVLVVLLLSNTVINESLPIFLDSAIGGGVAAILISTTAILIFGEVIPQSVCSRYGLSIGAAASPFVLVLMYLFSPIAWPTAKVLDWVLGEEGGNTYSKPELRTFLQFHRTAEHALRDDEISILNGVLSLGEKKVTEIMTPMKDVLTLSADTILDHSMVDHILTSGYSRIPIHDPRNEVNFIGFLLIKKLLTYDPEDALPISHFPLSILPEAGPKISCFQALDYFQTGRAHLLLISEHPGEPRGAIGVVTLEDIIEEIIEEEIVDETDQYESMHTKRKARRQSTVSIMRGIVERERRKLGSPLITAQKIADSPSKKTATDKLISIDEEEDDIVGSSPRYAQNGLSESPK